jgi:hypothetical protein
VRYTEVEKTVRALVAEADADHRRRLGADTVVRLTSDVELVDAAEAEFDEDAHQAFVEACADPVNSTAGRLRALLARVDAGTVSDGDMDPQVLSAITALDHWASYLAEESPDPVAELAILSLEEVDYQVSANLEDFLGTQEMAAEYARITTLLT